MSTMNTPTAVSTFLLQGLTTMIAVLFPGPFRRNPNMLLEGANPSKPVRENENDEAKPCPHSTTSGSTAGPQSSKSSSCSSGSDASSGSPPPQAENSIESVEQSSARHPGTPPLIQSFFKQVKLEPGNANTVKLIRKTVRLLEQCDYLQDEICSVLAHAGSYFEDVYGQCGHRMSSGEMGYILVVLIYIAHCHVLDEACPLRLWHQHLCQKYCSLPMLDAAVMRLMKMRGYKLRLAEDDLEMRYSCLLDAAGVKAADRSDSDFCFRE